MSDITLNYKGYCGSIETSVEDDCLFGKILFITDLVTYEATTPAQLKSAFENAVDLYVEQCSAQGLQPDKPFSGTLNVRLTQEMHRAAAIKAAGMGQTLNEFIKQCISLGIALDTSNIGRGGKPAA
ncbi:MULTISPECIES: type II toxin-antitoxin system HicB family antitoxin [unclassified Duganella]|uniref:type II toxin-antitoxin system HicB family antitoxin n=1 Tax=unclassified Duganella TaxID=2636909 RepID=UPI0006FCB297|nr:MULTISPECIES: type II toxin-antitoxin system HicB family antitoxin [unclassified Duganella]KQN70783.1 hypothetical protein ASF04_12890 [Duganella sp. Leaf61]MPQ57724.1 toxin-antitoxin system HicB family antitoxin [Duganella sp. FT27W]